MLKSGAQQTHKSQPANNGRVKPGPSSPASHITQGGTDAQSDDTEL